MPGTLLTIEKGQDLDSLIREGRQVDDEILKRLISGMKGGTFLEKVDDLLKIASPAFQGELKELKKIGLYLDNSAVRESCQSLVREIMRARVPGASVPSFSSDFGPYSSTTAYTDSQMIYANSGTDLVLAGKTDRDRLDLLYGLIVHEVSHVLYTDFNFMHQINDFFSGDLAKCPVKIEDIPEDLRPSFELLKNDISSSKQVANYLASYYHQLDNCIEDGYIEPRYQSEFRGSSTSSLTKLRNVFWNQMPSLETINKDIVSADRPDAIAWQALGALLPYAKYKTFKLEDESTKIEDMAVYSFMEPALDYIDKAVNNDFSSLRSKDSFCAFLSLYKKLKEIMPEFPPEPPSGPGGGGGGGGGPEDGPEGPGGGGGGPEGPGGLEPVEIIPTDEHSPTGGGFSSKVAEGKITSSDDDGKVSSDGGGSLAERERPKEPLIVEHPDIHVLEKDIAEARRQDALAKRNNDLLKDLPFRMVEYNKGPRADELWKKYGLDKAYRNGRNQAAALRDQLEKNKLLIKSRKQSRGKHVDIPSVINSKINNTERYYRKTQYPIPKDLASCQLIIDNSGSMSCEERDINAKRTAAALAGFFDELGIPYGVAGFSYGYVYENSSDIRITSESSEARASGYSGAHYTDRNCHNLIDIEEEKSEQALHKIALLETGGDEGCWPTLTFVQRKLDRLSEENNIKNKIIVMISDGGICHNWDLKATKTHVEFCQQEGIKILGISYSPSASKMLKDFLPNNNIIETFNPERSVPKLLQRMVDEINEMSQRNQ